MQGKINITVSHSILIEKPAEDVFDFTQDFSKRKLWDHSIVGCEIISEFPERKVRIKAKGGIDSTLEYKLSERPSRTSLRMTNISSGFIVDGGGSWSYEDCGNGVTLWTQTNTVSLQNSFLGIILRYFVRWVLMRNTIQAMKQAKIILEA